MQTLLEKIYQGEILSQMESNQLFNNIIGGDFDPTQLAAALVAMKVRGPHHQEIAGAATASLSQAIAFPRPDFDFADIVGTGGDGSNSINISTASTFVAAALGFPIAKHGSTSVSSRSGASDVLTSLGVNINMSPEQSRRALDELNVCFLFAQYYHAGFRHAAPVRKILKTRTIFNILGPLVNPARPTHILLGVYHPDLLLTIAETLVLLGYKHAAVIHGSGMDEVAVHSKTDVAELKGGEIVRYTLSPDDFGLATYTIDDLKGGTATENAQLLTALLQGKGKPAHEAAVAANVALLMRLFGHTDLTENSQQALAIIKSGKAYQLVNQLAKRGQ